MGKSLFLAFVLMLLGSMAFAEHAISLEPEAAPARAEPAAEATAPAPQTAAPITAPEPEAAPEAAPAPQQSSKVAVTLPSELDLYVVPAATREVCKTIAWGYDEIRTDCRTEPIPVRRQDPALRGLCVTRYGNRICY